MSKPLDKRISAADQFEQAIQDSFNKILAEIKKPPIKQPLYLSEKIKLEKEQESQKQVRYTATTGAKADEINNLHSEIQKELERIQLAAIKAKSATTTVNKVTFSTNKIEHVILPQPLHEVSQDKSDDPQKLLRLQELKLLCAEQDQMAASLLQHRLQVKEKWYQLCNEKKQIQSLILNGQCDEYRLHVKEEELTNELKNQTEQKANSYFQDTMKQLTKCTEYFGNQNKSLIQAIDDANRKKIGSRQPRTNSRVTQRQFAVLDDNLYRTERVGRSFVNSDQSKNQ